MLKKILSILGLSILFGGGAALASPLMSESDFTRAYVQYLSGKHPDIALSVARPLEIKAKSADHDFGTLFLHNLYELYRIDPSRQDELFFKFSSSILDHAQEPVAALDTLVAVVKSKSWVDEMNRMTMGDGGKGFTILSEPLAADLYKVYATDTPSSVTYLDREKILALDNSVATIQNAALRNLAKAVGRYHFEEFERGVYQAQSSSGDYDSSIPLLPNAFDDFIAKANTRDVVFSIPARNVLLVVDYRRADALMYLKVLTARVYNSDPYSVSPLLFTYTNQGWGIYNEK